MSIYYTTKNKKKYLLVKSNGGSDDLAVNSDYARDITDICKQQGYSAMLIDERDREYMLNEVLDLYKLANFFQTLNVSNIRMAIVCQPQYLEQIRYFEKTTHDHGMNIKFFLDPDSAKRWLL
jgi:hypothetical protein